MTDNQKHKKKVQIVCKENMIDLKILLIGNSGTGKTSFSNRWTKGTFDESYKATIMSNFTFKVVDYNSKKYKVQMWDLAGQDRNIILSKVFAKNADACIILTDMSDPSSLESSKKWKKEIDDNCRFSDSEEKIPCVLIQNKFDLFNFDNKEIEEEMKQFANENGYLDVYYTSAKTNYGIDECMEHLIAKVASMIDKCKDLKRYEQHDANRTTIVTQLNKPSKESLFQDKNCAC